MNKTEIVDRKGSKSDHVNVERSIRLGQTENDNDDRCSILTRR